MSKLIFFHVLVSLALLSISYAWKRPLVRSMGNQIPETSQLPLKTDASGKKAVIDASKALGVVLASSLFTPMVSYAEEKAKKKKKPKVLETDLGIPYIEIQKGSGPYPNTGDYIVMDYTAFLKNGTVYDSTEVKGRKPISFRFGYKQMIPGVESVVSYMQAGGEATCSIPAKYAYGEKGVCIDGQGCIVPPNEDIKYAIKVRNIGVGFN